MQEQTEGLATPRPWHADGLMVLGSSRGLDDRRIADCEWSESDTDESGEFTDSEIGEMEANAALIAAAPELLDMLKQVLQRLDLEPVEAVFPCSAMRSDIRAAINKAEGQ